MALKINQLDEQSLSGILDGVLAFQMTASEGGVIARIDNWTCILAGRTRCNVSGMRSSAYEALARFREEQKQTLNSNKLPAS